LNVLIIKIYRYKHRRSEEGSNTMYVTQKILPKDVLYCINQWCTNEIDQFVKQVLLISAQKKSPSFSNLETDLFLKINTGIPYELQQKYNRLIAKRDKSELTQNEYKELLRLTDRIEQFEAKRIEYLSQLAKLRKTTLSNLMIDLGINEPEII